MKKLMLLLWGMTIFLSMGHADVVPSVCIKRTCVEVEVARTVEETHRGLQGRTSLAPGHGMLFIFDREGTHNFWMKDTLIPLDMIWLDAQRRIIFIAANVPPCEEDPCPENGPVASSRYVLEVPAGYAKAQHFRVGVTADVLGV
jgi:uncharacterized membrane protein (UPF0127 family)